MGDNFKDFTEQLHKGKKDNPVTTEKTSNDKEKYKSIRIRVQDYERLRTAAFYQRKKIVDIVGEATDQIWEDMPDTFKK